MLSGPVFGTSVTFAMYPVLLKVILGSNDEVPALVTAGTPLKVSSPKNLLRISALDELKVL
jgi:hypothetical protein